MASHKRSALRKQRDAFEAGFCSAGGVDDIFAQEAHRREALDEERDAALRHKACESKNRYATRGEAEDAIATCAAHGRGGLHCYRCTYCKGWHLTSHPRT